MQRTAIKAQALVKHYDQVVAVNGIDIEIPEGSITGLLGGNGAGKTTTIAMLLGLVLPTSGKIELLGQDMSGQRHLALAQVNFESPYVDMPLRLSVVQNLRVYADLYMVPDARARIKELLRDLDLEALAKRPVGKLSAGQKTRVSLAKALINRPRILFLDEPTASLDPDTADWVRSYLETYQRDHGASILLASHNMAEVERMCDHVYMMQAGKIVDQGAPNDLIRRYGQSNMEEVFLDIARSRRRESERVL